MFGDYFKVKKELRSGNRLIPSGTVLYKYHSVKNLDSGEDGYKKFWFKDVDANHLTVVISSKEVPIYLEQLVSFDLFPLFQKFAPDILDAMKSHQREWLPTAARYVLQDMQNGNLDKAFAGLETECDKIRDSLLGEELRRFCISI